jgi:ribonuclease P/MRP protein subunit POP3
LHPQNFLIPLATELSSTNDLSLKVGASDIAVQCHNEDKQIPEESLKQLAAIFISETATNHLPYSHLPTLTALASARHSGLPKIRLVQLGTAAEAAISEALGLPRAGVVGVLADAPGAGPLLEYVREIVGAVDVPWTREVAAGEWLGTKILHGDERLEE